MTATTKEQRDDMRRLLESNWFKHAYHAGALPSLLTDSERLAAIEAVKLEDLPENVYLGDGRRADAVHEALLSLSAKVAEQAEEIERLKAEMSDARVAELAEEASGLFDECARLRQREAVLVAQAERMRTAILTCAMAAQTTSDISVIRNMLQHANDVANEPEDAALRDGKQGEDA